MEKWLVRRCSESNVFAWGFALVGIALMIIIALI